jgi:squalene-associated FAD-dependent desaturase
MEDGAQVAVIGGGYAGCAAAVTLASHGVRCQLFETAPVLGGRARRVERDGLRLDNGQHLLLGAYATTLALVRAVGAAPAHARRPLAVVPFAPTLPDALTLVARRAPGRLGLLVGLLATVGLSWRERLANIAWFRALERAGFARPAGETVAQMLRPLPPRVARLLWEPLNLAALNTPAEAASAQVFANVLKASFGGRGEDSDFVLPTTDLSSFFPEHAATYVQARGGAVCVGNRARVASSTAVVDEDRAHRVSATIVAVGPHQLDQAFAPEYLRNRPDIAARIDALGAMRYEPIATVWLGYAARVAMPGPIARLDDAPGQWVVDRPDIAAARSDLAQVLAVVISADGPHVHLPHPELVRATDAQLRRLAPALAPCAWSFVITEKRATYACTPGRPRVSGPRLAAGLYLAGDYVDETFPATIEAAARSGVAAAQAALADLRR